MIDSLNKILELNPINRLYNQLTGKMVFSAGESKPSDIFVASTSLEVPAVLYISMDDSYGKEFTFSNNGEVIEGWEPVDYAQIDSEELILEISYAFNIDIPLSMVGGYYVLGYCAEVTMPETLVKGEHTVELTLDSKTFSATYTQTPMMAILQNPEQDTTGYVIWNGNNNTGWTDPSTGEFKIGTETTDKFEFTGDFYTITEDSAEYLTRFQGWGGYPISITLDAGSYDVTYYYGDIASELSTIVIS